MKAILVIDIDANELPKDAYANVYVFGKCYEEQEDDFIACIGECPLKPMPKRVGEISYDFAYGWSKTFDRFIENQTKIEWLVKGWNACLEEIEK